MWKDALIVERWLKVFRTARNFTPFYLSMSPKVVCPIGHCVLGSTVRSSLEIAKLLTLDTEFDSSPLSDSLLSDLSATFWST